MICLSIIVPTWNEEKNVKLLTEEIHRVLTNHTINYELIFIDDRSTDKTVSIIKRLRKHYPISVHTKKGAQGKAYSILEGFHHAQYNLICMIDADLQYPPSDIPKLIAKHISGVDIVVAKRKQYDAGILRKCMSTIFHGIFIKALHGFDEDVQSGLKVFTKETISHMTIQPTQWTFDLAFLLSARRAGYTIASVPITFKKRHAGTSKIAVIQSSYEIALNALILKLVDMKLLPLRTLIMRGRTLLRI